MNAEAYPNRNDMSNRALSDRAICDLMEIERRLGRKSGQGRKLERLIDRVVTFTRCFPEEPLYVAERKAVANLRDAP